MTEDARSELTSRGTLRVGINLGNILLVTGTGPEGEPQGVAPDMAAAIAERLGVGVSYVTYATPGELEHGLYALATGARFCAAEVAALTSEPRLARVYLAHDAREEGGSPCPKP